MCDQDTTVIRLGWHMPPKSDLIEQVRMAARRMKERISVAPSVVEMHDTDIPEGLKEIDGMTVISSSRVSRQHLFLRAGDTNG